MGFPALLILDLNLVSNQTMLQHYHLDVSALFTYVVRFPISCMNVRKKFTDARIPNNLSISKALITLSVEQDILQDFCKKYLRGRRAKIILKSSQMNLDPLFHLSNNSRRTLIWTWCNVPEKSDCDCVLAIISLRLSFFGCSVLIMMMDDKRCCSAVWMEWLRILTGCSYILCYLKCF